MKIVPVLLAFAVVLLGCSEAYQMTRCQLVKALRKCGFPENQLRNWVCLVENESSRRTHVIGPWNSNGSRDWGLFQINDRYWCSISNRPGKDCNVRCQDLLRDDIAKACACAKVIYRRHGYSAWVGWNRRCKGKPLPDIRGFQKRHQLRAAVPFEEGDVTFHYPVK